MPLPIYSIDSSALIHGWRRIYRPRNFGVIWRHIDGLIADGRLRASIEVYREMEQKDDELFAWCRERRQALFVEIDDACQEHVSRIMGLFPDLSILGKGALRRRSLRDRPGRNRATADDCRDRRKPGAPTYPGCLHRRGYTAPTAARSD
jgi:hypothetical protein